MKTYTATFSDGSTHSKNSKSKKGFPFAALTTTADGSYSVSFSHSKKSLANNHHLNIRMAKEVLEYETDQNLIKILENDLTGTIEIVETVVS